ncbi:hypothetical protein [uncultured Phascolarctobacterium sp.]|nr:hypothetical protein [uncultured Phascolarctobacterium sp.]
MVKTNAALSPNGLVENAALFFAESVRILQQQVKMRVVTRTYILL